MCKIWLHPKGLEPNPTLCIQAEYRKIKLRTDPKFITLYRRLKIKNQIIKAYEKAQSEHSK